MEGTWSCQGIIRYLLISPQDMVVFITQVGSCIREEYATSQQMTFLCPSCPELLACRHAVLPVQDGWRSRSYFSPFMEQSLLTEISFHPSSQRALLSHRPDETAWASSARASLLDHCTRQLQYHLSPKAVPSSSVLLQMQLLPPVSTLTPPASLCSLNVCLVLI